MGAFRRVEDSQAGPTALGILIPPSRRTFLILRPRSLPFDLLFLQRPDDTAFRELAHDEAAAAAHNLFRALREWAEGGQGGIDFIAHDEAEGSYLRVQIGPFYLIACERMAGKPYRPLLFADAPSVVPELTAILCPRAGVEQELYFNTRHFMA
jgi:hypothetical protein